MRLVRSFEQGEVTVCPFPTVTSAFYHHALSFPDAIATRDMTTTPCREMTYTELAKRVQSLAKKLKDLGVGPGQRVPLLVKRGEEMIIGIWAVLSCGAQYVPMDGGVVPESTIRTVMEQSGCSVILCMASTEHRLYAMPERDSLIPIRIEGHSALTQGDLRDQVLLDLATPESGCYVIYTSGTTGKPKGVDVTHKNVSNLVCQAPGSLGVRPGTCVGSILNISFDMGM